MITEARSGKECHSLYAAYNVIIQVARGWEMTVARVEFLGNPVGDPGIWSWELPGTK